MRVCATYGTTSSPRYGSHKIMMFYGFDVVGDDLGAALTSVALSFCRDYTRRRCFAQVRAKTGFRSRSVEWHIRTYSSCAKINPYIWLFPLRALWSIFLSTPTLELAENNKSPYVGTEQNETAICRRAINPVLLRKPWLPGCVSALECH